MATSMKYFVWRGGKPRWVPGATLRVKGAKALDLKDKHGRYLPLQAALDRAHELNVFWAVSSEPVLAAAVLSSQSSVNTAENERLAGVMGYVYFLQTDQRVKIGFSTKPQHRIGGLMVGNGAPIGLWVAVPGSRLDERAIHKRLEGHHLQGEWFHASVDVMNLIGWCVHERKAVHDETAIRPLVSRRRQE